MKLCFANEAGHTGQGLNKLFPRIPFLNATVATHERRETTEKIKGLKLLGLERLHYIIGEASQFLFIEFEVSAEVS